MTSLFACTGLVAVLASAGCINRDVSHTMVGGHVNTEAFGRITEGKTSAAWVESSMGKPSSIKKIDDTTEVWTWTGADQKIVNAQFILVTDHSQVTEHTTATVEVRNGIVTKKWVDSYTVKDHERIN